MNLKELTLGSSALFTRVRKIQEEWPIMMNYCKHRKNAGKSSQLENVGNHSIVALMQQ